MNIQSIKNSAINSKLGKAVAAPFQKMKGFIDRDVAKGKEASRIMDQRYPSGWSQNESNMNELRQIKNNLK